MQCNFSCADCKDMITNKNETLVLWKYHFDNHLNRRSSTDDNIINYFPQISEFWWDRKRSWFKVVNSAMRQLSSGKSPASHGIPPEVYQNSSNCVAKELAKPFCYISLHWCVHLEYKDASLLYLCKRKGNKSVCDNHRRIRLLLIAGRILARVILKGLYII